MDSASLSALQEQAASVLSGQARLDLLDVAVGLRPSARILVRPGREVMAAGGLLETLGLDACVARGLARVPLGSSFVDAFAPIGADSAERMAVLYVASRRDRAESARACDERADDAALGRALGYPECCVRAVLACGRVPTMSESIAAYSRAGTYDPLAWPAAAVADGPLLAHFPCGVGCPDSRRLALGRWTAVRRHVPELALRVQVAARARYWTDAAGTVRSDASTPMPAGTSGVVGPGSDLPRGPD